jgi:hypothetical protein
VTDWTTNPILASAPANPTPQPARQQVFVFGSNLSGIHGAGAALHAKQVHGAVQGVGAGRTGNAYALPTKGVQVRTRSGKPYLPTLPLQQVDAHAALFKLYARDNLATDFKLTAVGCGLAGFTAAQIAPLFADSTHNVLFPPEWRAVFAHLPANRFWEY